MFVLSRKWQLWTFCITLVEILLVFHIAAGQVGSLSEVKRPDEEISLICEGLKPQVERETRERFPVFALVSYKTQIVHGTVYFMKVAVGNDEFIHIKAFKPLPHAKVQTVSLLGVQSDKTANDPILYF